jgi:type IV secretory pathway VirJ component
MIESALDLNYRTRAVKYVIRTCKIFSVTLSFLLSFSELTGQKLVSDSTSIYPFGKVWLYSVSNEKPINLIIMISGDGGWKSGVPRFAKEFAGNGSIVVGVDILSYYKHLRQLTGDCYLLAPDFADLSNAVELKFNFPEYVPPVIMGYSSGATLVYGILTQAREGTFMGGISLGFCPDIELPKPLCMRSGLKCTELVKGKSYLLFPDSLLANPWIILHGKKDRVCDFKTVAEFVHKTSEAKLIELPEVGHGFSKWSDFFPQWKSAYASLINKYHQHQNLPGQVTDLQGIPYTFIKEKVITGKKMVVLLFSGDGGWYGFEQSISEHLGNLGIPVIGIDLKKYLWNRITPQKAGMDAGKLLSYYGEKTDKPDFVILGYSQGAEIVPFVFNNLPEYVQLKVKSLIMLSPAATTDFKIHITDMLGLGNKQDILSVTDEISKIANPKQVVIFGESEKTLVPAILQNTSVEVIRIPGDHHFKGDTGLIVKKLVESRAL